MRRRALLARGGALGCSLALAGCTTDALRDAQRPPPLFEGAGLESVDLPVTQPLGVAEAGIERTATAEIDSPDALAAVLRDRGLDVLDLTAAGDGEVSLVSLQYRAQGATRQGLMHQLGDVAGGYAALAAAEQAGERLTATVFDRSDEAFGAYEIRRPWAEAYLDGETTAREYADEIGITVETV